MRYLNSSPEFHAAPRGIQRFGVLFLVLVFASIFSLRSQAQVTNGSNSNAKDPTGSIGGKVSEKHGGPLAGARVTISNTNTGVASSVATDVDGQFLVENLPPGVYKVSISADGCVPQEEKVPVKTGHKSRLSTTLKPVAQQPPAQQ